MINLENSAWYSMNCMFFTFWVVRTGTISSYVWTPKIIQTVKFQLLFPQAQYFSLIHVYTNACSHNKGTPLQTCVFLCLSLSLSLSLQLPSQIFCPTTSSQFDLFQLQILPPRLEITTWVCSYIHYLADLWTPPLNIKPGQSYDSSYVFLLSGTVVPARAQCLKRVVLYFLSCVLFV